MRRTSYNDINSLGGMTPPPRINYEPTVKEKMCFKAITFMKPYSQYSFEELRFCSPNQTRVTETLYAQDMEDGTFSVHWTPNSVGNYCLTVMVDGISLEEVYRVEVKEGGAPPPHRMAIKTSQPQNKLRKFVAKNSAGLRIRSHPALQSEQVGIVKMNGIISFIDEIENDDGIWVRLSTVSIREHCSTGWYPTEAWCLQYNQHLGKTLLYPLLEEQSVKPAVPKNKPKINMIDNPEIVSAEPSPKILTNSPIKKLVDSPKGTPQSAETISSSMTNPFLFSSSNKLFESDRSDEQSENHLNDEINSDHQTNVENTMSTANEALRKVQTMATSQDDSSSIHSSSPSSNLGSAIAGVVGGGASKLQALQKWFKGDNSVDPKENQRKRAEDDRKVYEASVSVKDLVRAIGAQESRSNGNSDGGQYSATNSSPVQVPTMKHINEGQSFCSSSSKSVEDTSALVSSLTRDLSHSPSRSSTKDDISSSPKFQTDTNSSHSDLHAIATTVSKLNYFPSTPKHTSKKHKPKKPIPTPGIATNIQSEAVSSEKPLTVNTKCTTNAQKDLEQQQTASPDTSSAPVWPPAAPHQYSHSIITPLPVGKDKPTSMDNVLKMGPPKRAMPPSLAESLRAIFAAILWHEGIVHDAMSCASFLKFHPNLPKEGALVVTRRDAHDNCTTNLSKEQKAQQRHSVEVANAGNYLNIRPSTLETLTKSGVSSINNRRLRKGANDSESQNNEKTKLHSLPEVVAVLPPALKCLVYLWEQLCTNSAHIVQSNTLENQKTSPKYYSSKDKIDNHDKDNRKLRKKKKDDASWCEFCEIFLPIPVTYHMRIVHPGCGKPAKGKGYNSVGIYCEGWAGNCGEGGKGAYSWFLMCDQCREKYISVNKNINNLNNSSNQVSSPNDLFNNRTSNSFHANSEIYSMMKENAMFLLELSSSTSQNSNPLVTQQKRSPGQMPVVAEGQINIFADINKPSTSRGGETSHRNSRIGLKMNSNKFNPFSSTPSRKSFPNCNSPDSMWLAPEVFSCLESLGASMADDMPYEIFGINSGDNLFERPLSEISFDSCDQHNSEIMKTSGSAHGSGTLSKFHRSFSMIQGWSNHSPQKSGMTVYPANFDENSVTKVVMRRRKTSSSETESSLMLCYPSENLRKLVPENVLSRSFIIPKYNNSIPPPPPPPVLVDKDLLEKSDQTNNISSLTSKDSTLSTKYKYEKDTSTSNNPKDHCIDMEPNHNYLLNRPTMAFITQQHDLEKLRYVMKRSLRIATCRIYSLQALNWLIRSVTQTCCLHDLMWWFVSALSCATYEEHIETNFKSDDNEMALEHPVSYIQMSGKVSQNVSQSLHSFLQSVADLTLLLPAGSSLQRMAIQCFGIKFKQADHQFLHSSHVFGNISKILSKSDEQNEAMLISSIVAMSESNGHMLDQAYGSPVSNAGAKLFNYTDLNGMFEITVSSRQALADSLTDNSTETFWESDEEDRNKCKIIEISMNKMNYVCKAVFVHIDNSRDIQNKVLNVVFFAGQSLGDTNLIKTIDIDSKVCTWISAKIPDESFTHFRLELRGPENTLRVRQIKLLGVPASIDDVVVYGKPNLKLSNATQIQQRICEVETLRVFRLITAQVFGKLISTSDNVNENVNWATQGSMMESSANSVLADSLDLREHMVGILFSRSKLSHLQKQVIVHIVHAIKKEAQRAKEEWEMSNATTNFKDINNVGVDQKSDSSVERYRSPDTYCFEMLSMVLALSGSAVGRSYLSHQHGLLKDLLSLLHTGSDRVQRQVTALLRRILPEISPENLGELLGVQKMPPADFNIVNQNPSDFDMNRLGILDIFLAVIAKSIQLQVKIKTSTKPAMDKSPAFVKLCNCIDFSVHTLKKKDLSDFVMDDKNHVEAPAHFAFDTGPVVKGFTMDLIDFDRNPKKQLKEAVSKNLNQRWFLKGAISNKQAESIIALVRDMTSGKLTEKWSLITKAAIAESVLNLTRLDEVFRNPENCIKTSTLWLALASLCVLDKEHVEKLSSGQWSNSDTRPLCSNHDDGETSAIIQCETCGSLCSDCDRFLHLSRKTRHHRRTVCKEEEEAIRVELHESCGRTKLFWLLALADSKTLKGVVEFRDGANTIISGPQDTVGRCRFCGVIGNTGLLEIGNVCADSQCQELAANSCQRIKSCGHSCGGVIGEQKCLPCLQHVCHDRENQLVEGSKLPKLTQDADDMCMICFVEALACAPSIQLECGHVFHYHCSKAVLEKRWNGPRISFGFSLCPICKADIEHDLLSNVLQPINNLKQDVKRKALMRLKYEGVIKDSDNKDLAAMAMDRYAYYVCFKCQKAYYGGEARCHAEVGDKYNPEELVCGACSDVARAQMCPKHGTDFLEYKCRYCCSVAVFFCFGTTHFCDTCHDDFQHLTNIPKNKLPQCPCGPKATQLVGDECPLHVVHPPTGEEFALGCGICRNAHTF
ncbi:E3 ubiquitin-protein ligase highwire-like [Condylostylus longicornis]|uniref:E3 ubiquitin-protein ligase highwire-like n=1 Tax=Condylostylus longicornis TaxID=2530218 RepID=UPI00244E4887|nr:E3 ubiquitin-protein ligase highwire-like [Condylostylus longicornis]